MPLQIQDGQIIGVSATGGCTAGTIWMGVDIGGVFLDTYAASASNTNVPVALSGVFTVAKIAHADGWGAGEKIYARTTGGANKAIAAASGTVVPLGVAVETTTTGATTGKVRLCGPF